MIRQRAFTLVELLVALFITAVVFALGYGAIEQAVRNREALAANQERIADLQRAIRILVQDLSQVVARPVRDAVGSGLEAAFVGNAGDGTLLAVTRAGWANPAGVQRASLQRVRYRLVDGKLQRESLAELDAVAAAPKRIRNLIDGVQSVRVRFRDQSGSWVEVWPQPSAVGGAEAAFFKRPIAVEVTIEFSDWGRIVRLIEVAS